MKQLGLIGGTTWVSTIDYYRVLNEEVNKVLGGNHSAPLLLYSVEFGEVIEFSKSGDFALVHRILTDAAEVLYKAGVDGIMLCANTIHKYADNIMEEVPLPLIHVVDETAVKIKEKGFHKVGLLGTMMTMKEDFYTNMLGKEGIECIIPDEQDMQFINHAIFEELGHDIFKDETRQRLLKIMNGLSNQGAEGIILGCTEIPLIIKPEHTDLPLFDTLRIHAEAGAKFILG